jgi:hypothetical protein
VRYAEIFNPDAKSVMMTFTLKSWKVNPQCFTVGKHIDGFIPWCGKLSYSCRVIAVELRRTKNLLLKIGSDPFGLSGRFCW